MSLKQYVQGNYMYNTWGVHFLKILYIIIQVCIEILNVNCMVSKFRMHLKTFPSLYKQKSMKSCCLALRTQTRKQLRTTTIKEASTQTKELSEWVSILRKLWAALDDDP